MGTTSSEKCVVQHFNRLRANQVRPQTNETERTKLGRSSRAKGNQFERDVAVHLTNLGFYVKRDSSSKGVEDIFAVRKRCYNDTSSFTELLFIQCKLNKDTFNGKDWNELYELATKHNGLPILAHKPENGTYLFLRLAYPLEKKNGRWGGKKYLEINGLNRYPKNRKQVKDEVISE